MTIFCVAFVAEAAITVEDAIRQIDKRRLEWIGLTADVTLSFFNGNKEAATCKGNLAYQRLEERIFLDCSQPNGKLLFVLQTSDRHFELYLADLKTAYFGDIFDLIDSPDFESHLNPLDLYRALKPLSVPRQGTTLQEVNGVMYLAVHKDASPTSYLERDLLGTREGDVYLERYYETAGEVQLIIRRSDFRTVFKEKKTEIVFPHRIHVETLKEGRATTIDFNRISFALSLDEESLNFSYPTGTQIIKVT